MAREAIRALLGDLEPQKEEKQLRVEIDSGLEDALETVIKKFGCAVDAESHNPTDKIYKSAIGSISHHKIGQEFIDWFILMLRDYQHKEHFEKMAGIYLTAMVRAAYLQGNNNLSLMLTFLEKKVSGFGRNIKAQENKPLFISINGDLDDNCLEGCVCVDAKITGSVGRLLGGFAEFSNINVVGNVGERCAYDAWESNFTVIGTVDHSFGMWAKHTVLKCTNQDSVKSLQRYICEGCSVYWIDEAGAEKLVASTPPSPQINIDGEYTYESRKHKRAA
ncbi:MAG: hypothetical protein HY438_00255 [DPANN group archaeon]|nr:hypothetical protein [DPANN group archaeon]